MNTQTPSNAPTDAVIVDPKPSEQVQAVDEQRPQNADTAVDAVIKTENKPEVVQASNSPYQGRR